MRWRVCNPASMRTTGGLSRGDAATLLQCAERPPGERISFRRPSRDRPGGRGFGDETAPLGSRPERNPGTLVGGCRPDLDRKSTRLNSSHLGISYAVFCLKKKKQ